MRLFYILIIFIFGIAEANALSTYADIVEELMPSVVNISTKKEVVEENEGIDNVMLNKELDSRESLGSGFFISSDGYILTNYHVIKGAKEVNVITNDNSLYTSKVIGTDKSSDLAVLKITPEDSAKSFASVKFGNADKSRIGDIVLTFGNPYGLGVSVSQGIISAKSRNIGLGEQQYIQTDASINQGNSGGPMFNIDGEVIGVNSAIFTTIGADGVGFSLPSNMANWVASQLIKNGKVKRGWLGLSVSHGIDKYTNKEGFVITEINEESNAYKEGLRVGDIITHYNDKPAGDLSDFIQLTETMDIGQAIRLKAISYGEEFKYVVRVQEMPKEELKGITNKALQESITKSNQTGDDVFYVSELGITAKEARPRGIMIIKMDRLSPLKNKGIVVGDIILEIDRGDIYSVDNLLDGIRNAIVDDFRPISLLVQNQTNVFYASITLEPEND